MKNIQIKFQRLYKRLDEALKIKLNRPFGGIESYIGFLINYGVSALEVTERLMKYSERINQPEGSLSLSLTRSDIAWMNGFLKKISGKKDPLTKYLNCR